MVNANSKGYLGKTPLSYAEENGHWDVMNLLLATRMVEADSEEKESWSRLSPPSPPRPKLLTLRPDQVKLRDSALVSYSLQIPSYISPRGGSLADLAAQVS